MKILQIHTQTAAGGTQRISDLVAAGLRSRGHTVRTVFMYRYSPAYDHADDADILFKGSVRAGRIGAGIDKARAVLMLVRYLLRERPDAVITYEFWGNLFGSIAARIARVPLVIANQSMAPTRTGRLGLLTRIDRVLGSFGAYSYNVVNSTWTQAQFDGYPSAYRRRLRLISHGAYYPSAMPEQTAARRRYDLPADVRLVVSTGRLSDLKNHRVLIEALPALPGVHLAIAGNGPRRDMLSALAQDIGCADRVHLVGEVPPAEIFDFLAAGDIFAFPSQSETFGLSVVEAAIGGLPVVATDLPVLREVLATEAGEPAALFAPPDAAGFAAALKLLVQSPETARDLTRAGRALQQIYDPDRMAAGYAALLSQDSTAPVTGTAAIGLSIPPS